MTNLISAEPAELLKEYIRENQQGFYRLAYSYTKNPDDAMDVVQEAIVKAISSVHKLKKPEFLKTWFYRILVNEALIFLRKAKKTIPEEDIADNAVYEDGDVPQRVDLARAVDRLDPKIRTVIVLRFFEDMKLEEIARVTHANLSTVKSRLYRGLQLLKISVSEE